MRYFKLFFNFLLLFTIPSFLLYPEAEISTTIFPTQTTSVKNDNFLSYDDILTFIEEIENGELEKRYNYEELGKINKFIAFLAKEGTICGDSIKDLILENDIEELLSGEEDPFHYLFSNDSENDYLIIPAVSFNKGEIVLCKSWIKKQWKQTKKFVKKHKKAIIIGATVAVVVIATVVVVASCPAAAPAAAEAASAAVAAGASAVSDSSKKNRGEEGKNSSSPSVAMNSPLMDPVPIKLEDLFLDEAVQEDLTLFKEHFTEKMPPEFESSSYNGDASYWESIKETARFVGSDVAHKVLDAGAEAGKLIPADHKDSYENFISQGHKKIDEFFSTDLADNYSPEAKEIIDRLGLGMTYGALPPPGNLINGALKAVAIAEAAGIATSAALVGSIATQPDIGKPVEFEKGTYIESSIIERSRMNSIEKYKNAEGFLDPHSKGFIPEMQARELIHQTGIRTFSRPAGLPENYIVRITDRGAGMEYVHPTNSHTRVRIMPGKPHSPHLHQQKPYVVQMKDGKILDKLGNVVLRDSPEAHIPLEEFVYIGE